LPGFSYKCTSKLQHLYPQVDKLLKKYKKSLLIKEYISPFKNRWLIFLTHLGFTKDEYGDKVGKYHIVPTVIDKSNRWNLYLFDDNYLVTKYTGHFFERYAERFLEWDNYNILDVAKEFIPRNNASSANHWKDDEEFFAIIEDGVCLGTDECNLRTFKTYINPDMLFTGGQCELYDEGLEEYNRYKFQMEWFKEQNWSDLGINGNNTFNVA
jgi:hypothetical protein